MTFISKVTIGLVLATQSLCSLALPVFCESSSFKATVVSITDGDTIKVLINDDIRETVRLQSIDCPESDQAFGKDATEQTTLLCFEKEVVIVPHGRDRYHRLIGDISLLDGRNINSELVRTGYAWWFRKYAPSDTRLEALEKEARKKRVGLWHDMEPIPPWEFRHQKRLPKKTISNYLSKTSRACLIIAPAKGGKRLLCIAAGT